MKKKFISINHISHGISETGGFRHEHFLFEKISERFQKNNFEVKPNTIRAKRFFKGFSQIKLLWWSFLRSNADVNIVVVRTALSSILRNLFSECKTLIVLHYFDERDGKGIFLKWYYLFLFYILKKINLPNVAVVVVSTFWENYFKEKISSKIPVFLFPNFFETQKYLKFKTSEKLKQIHLGQFSWKNDKRIFDVAKKLKELGFKCYFSTLSEKESGNFDNYEVIFEDHNSFLKRMAESMYTIAFVGINEGWNRIAHESILVGTDVIGNDAGGLSDLLNESGSLIANDEKDIMNYISENKSIEVIPDFIQNYDVKNSEKFLEPIMKFLSP